MQSPSAFRYIPLYTNAIVKISNSLFTSKVRYGLQLLGCVRYKDSDATNQELEAIQKCQNKLVRILNGSRISDKISSKSLLEKFKMLSINQMNAQIKLLEIWKTINVKDYPIKTKFVSRSDDIVITRAFSLGYLQENRITNFSKRTFLNDATHIWIWLHQC